MPRKSITNSLGQYRCCCCKQFKDLDEFYPVPPSQRGQKSQYCKACTLEKLYIGRQKKRLKEVGPEAFQKEIEYDQNRIQERLNLLLNYRKENP